MPCIIFYARFSLHPRQQGLWAEKPLIPSMPHTYWLASVMYLWSARAIKLRRWWGKLSHISLIIQAWSYGGGHSIPKAVRESKSQIQVTFKSLLVSCLLSSHWPKHVTWPRPDSSHGKTTQEFDMGRCEKNQGLLLQPPSCDLDPAGRRGGKNGEKWMDFHYIW